MSPTALNRAISAYAAAGTRVPPLEAVVRLYEKALAHLRRARDAARERAFERHFDEINRAIMIFAGLDGVLNDEAGGDVAATLRQFYRTVIAQAGLAAARKDPAAATDAIVRQVSHMLDAWRSIAAERGNAAGTPRSTPGTREAHAPVRILS